MTGPADKAAKLLALALDPGASPEEARTAAMAAARVISENRLLEDSGADVFARARPIEHCAGCRCYSNVDYVRERPGPARAAAPSWRRDFDDRPKAEADRKYAARWDAIWGSR